MTVTDFTLSRKNMVDSQLKTNKVTDERIIAAFGDIPREQFVPEKLKQLAYIDSNLELSAGRFLMEPMVFARLLEEASIKGSDVCLDVGPGSGYSSVILGRIASTVFALESDSFLSKQATQNFLDHGADNVFLIEGPLNMDGVEHGPFDVILLGGSVEVIPTALISQLSEGGRLLTVMHQKTGSGKAILFEKHHGSISERQLFDANVRPLPGVFEEQVKFKF